MASSLDEVRRQLATFLAGGDLMPFWRTVMDATETIDHDPHATDSDREWFDELYELVYMGSEEPISARDRKDGLMSAAELRGQIREFHLDGSDPRPA